jgi:hypothetical protein
MFLVEAKTKVRASRTVRDVAGSRFRFAECSIYKLKGFAVELPKLWVSRQRKRSAVDQIV